MNSDAAVARLKSAEWLKRAETQRVYALLDGPKNKIRAVGGIVRDTLLDRPRDLAEIDFATELLPQEVMKRAGEAGIAAYPTGIEHGTVTLKVNELVAEITTLRQDVETDGRHAVVKFGRDWTRDAQRRDFTLNALYVGMDGTLFDPLDGIEDCLRGVVRFIGDPDRRIAEDRLRVYRFFRFSASHGGERFDLGGLDAVRRAATTLGALSAERVGAEMRRMLGLPHVAKTLDTMAAANVAPLPQPLREWMAAYERRAHKPNLPARLALMLPVVGAEQIRERWRLSNDDLHVAEMILKAARLLIEFHVNEAAYRYPAALADAVDVAATIAGWTEAGKSAVVEHLAGIDVPKFPLTGNDLLQNGMRPGPALGAELERLERKWISSNFTLDRAGLLAELRR